MSLREELQRKQQRWMAERERELDRHEAQEVLGLGNKVDDHRLLDRVTSQIAERMQVEMRLQNARAMQDGAVGDRVERLLERHLEAHTCGRHGQRSRRPGSDRAGHLWLEAPSRLGTAALCALEQSCGRVVPAVQPWSLRGALPLARARPWRARPSVQVRYLPRAHERQGAAADAALPVRPHVLRRVPAPAARAVRQARVPALPAADLLAGAQRVAAAGVCLQHCVRACSRVHACSTACQVIDAYVERQHSMAQGKILPEILAQQGAEAEARGDTVRTGGGGGGGGGGYSGGSGGGGGGSGGRDAGADAARFSEEYRSVTMRSRVLEQVRTVATHCGDADRGSTYYGHTHCGSTYSLLTVALPTIPWLYLACPGRSCSRHVRSCRPCASGAPRRRSCSGEDRRAMGERPPPTGAAEAPAGTECSCVLVRRHMQEEEAAAAARLEAARLEHGLVRGQAAE